MLSGRVERTNTWAQVLHPAHDQFVLVRPDNSWHLFDQAYVSVDHELYEKHSRQLKSLSAPLKRTPQVSMIVFVSEACNLRCDYCKVSSMITAPNKIQTDAKAIAAAIQTTAEGTIGQVDVIFYGGEPLLEFEAIDEICREVAASVVGNRVAFSMTTNGTLLTERMLEIMLNHRICVGVSIDGNPLTHNAHRVNLAGRDTHARAVANYRTMKKAGVECGPISVVTDPSKLEKVFDYFVTEFDETNIHLKPLEVRGSEDVSWLKDYFEEYVDCQLRLLSRCVSEFKMGQTRRCETRTAGAVRNVLLSGNLDVLSCHTSGMQGCSIGQEIFGIEANGVRIPCPNVKKYARKDPIFIKIIETRGGYCDECSYKQICPSFCLAEMDEKFIEGFNDRGETGPVDVLCASNRRLVDGIFRLYREDAIAVTQYAAIL